MAVFGTIGEFMEGDDWDEYTERLDQYFIANSIADTDTVQKRKAVLISVVGARTYGLMKTLLAPQKPVDKTYNDLVTLIRNHVSPKPPVIAERYKFWSRRQNPGEKVSQYLTELRKMSDSCDFGDFLNDALRDMFVIGLSDKSAQKKMLSEADLTIQKAYEMALGHETANRQVEEIHGHSHEAVKKFTSRARPGTHDECVRCGRTNHTSEDCYHKRTVCYKCDQMGHIGRKCPGFTTSKEKKGGRETHMKKKTHYSKKKKANIRKIQESSSDETTDSESDSEIESGIKSLSMNFIRSVAMKGHPEILLDVKINNQPVKMELDTGAPVSIMPRKIQKRMFPEIKMHRSKVVLKSYTKDVVPVVGKCYVNVVYNTQTVKLPLHIVRGHGPALFGRDWLAKIQLDWKHVQNICVHNITAEHQGPHVSILQKYEELFQDSLGKVNKMQATLHVKSDAKPKFFKARPVPFALREGIARELQRQEELGIIKKIDYSNWAAPIVPVVKPSGDIRICGDYKVTINQDLELPEHPMPRIEELLQKLNGGDKFTKLDLSQAYSQIELDESSRQYVTINTHMGLYTYTRLPYGISAAPALFQATMDKLLQGLEVGCFQDDIIITGQNDEDHLKNLDAVLKRLHEAGLKLQKSKCHFMVPSVTYLGYVIDRDGVRMDNESTEAIRDAPPPTCKSELRSLLGLVSHYRKYLPNMATLCNPLNQLLQKDKPFLWSQECEATFRKLKELLTSRDLVLTHYDPNKRLSLAVDASPVGLGAVISHPTPFGERPIAYASRSLTSAERNYSQIEREGLAIVFGLTKFHQYVYGRKFTLVTDNKPLSLIFGPKKGIPVMAATRIQRWAIQLAAYNYDIQHVSSAKNGNVDCLSRLPLKSSDDSKTSNPWTTEATQVNLMQINSLPVTAKNISRATIHDPTLAKVMYFVTNHWPSGEDLAPDILPYFNRRHELSVEEGCILWGIRTVIPSTLQEQLLRELHSEHIGMVRMKALARLHFWWPKLDKDIEDLVQRCGSCQEMLPKAPKADGNPWKWPSAPWQRIHIDFAGPFLGENFLIVVDAHSKWPEVFRMKSITATNTIEKLRQAFAANGLPTEIVSDNGRQFASDEFKQFVKANNIKHIFSPPYHPSTNGEAERFVRTFKRNMKLKKGMQTSWNHKICDFLLSYRTTPHSTTHRTPAEMNAGRNLRTKLSAVHPNIADRIQKQSSSEKVARQIEIGEPVLARDYRRQKETWIAGVVSKKLGPCTYSVLVGDLVWKRHIDQLRGTDGSLLNTTSVAATEDSELSVTVPQIFQHKDLENTQHNNQLFGSGQHGQHTEHDSQRQEVPVHDHVPATADIDEVTEPLAPSSTARLVSDNIEQRVCNSSPPLRRSTRNSNDRAMATTAQSDALLRRSSRHNNDRVTPTITQSDPPLRRSTRHRKEPAYLKDYA